MVSRESRVILVAIFILVPLALFVVNRFEQGIGTDLPQWAGIATLLIAGVLLPQLYLWYTSNDASPVE